MYVDQFVTSLVWCLHTVIHSTGVWCVPGFLFFNYIWYQVSDHFTCACRCTFTLCTVRSRRGDRVYLCSSEVSVQLSSVQEIQIVCVSMISLWDQVGKHLHSLTYIVQEVVTCTCMPPVEVFATKIKVFGQLGKSMLPSKLLIT